MLIKYDKAENCFAFVSGEYFFCSLNGKKQEEVAKLYTLCDLINTHKEVKSLLLMANEGLAVSLNGVYAILQFTSKLLTNFKIFVENGTQKTGTAAFKKDILKNLVSGKCWNNLEKLQNNTTATAVYNCLTTRPYIYNFENEYFNDRQFVQLHRRVIVNILRGCYVNNIKSSMNGLYCSVEDIKHAIDEIEEVLTFMGKTVWECCCNIFVMPDLGNRRYKLYYDTFGKEYGSDVINDTQTLTINRPKQQENKIITVGNKKAYQVGKGDYKHRNGVIIEEKADMNRIYTYPVGDKNILADLEDLLNNIIDNPDTVDNLVNYLEKNAPAAHFISEMVGCGEIDNEESLIGALNKATSLSQGMIAAGKNVRVQGGEYKVYNYLNVDYPKPIFGREFSLKQLSFCFDVAAREIEDIFAKAKAEEEAEEALEEVIADAAQAQAKEIEDILYSAEEEKEEVITNDDVQEHAEEDCEAYPADLEELQKLLEERRKKEAELDAEIKQAEEEARRKELVEQLLAADNRIKEKEARLAQLRKK